jgi:hypothetical protein
MTNPTKPKRQKKRFTSREQIIARIDKFTKKAENQRANQRERYSAANNLRRVALPTNDADLLEKAKKADADGDKLGRKADRLEKDVLGALRAKLAEFDTQTIPGITTDRSVEAL